jgi:predicted dehydrogenase
MKLGVIGYGYWGPNLVRNFAETFTCQIASVADLSPSRLHHLQARYPAIHATLSADEIIQDPNIDAVAIATPVSTHFDLAMRALRAGKHVLVEKPICDSLDNACRLADEAERRGLVLMVDHTFVYHGAVRRLKQVLDDGDLGDLYYFDSVRVNLGVFQSDVSVLWDLAVHDLSILNYLVAARPSAVAAAGVSHVKGRPADIAYLTLFYDCNLIAHIHVNWLAPVKIRRTLIGGNRQMAIYDDLEQSEKIKIYDKGITVDGDPEEVYKLLISYRTGDMRAPRFDMTEALRVEVDHFLDCVQNGKRPITDARSGAEVVEILELATRSIAENGRPIEVVRSRSAKA